MKALPREIVGSGLHHVTCSTARVILGAALHTVNNVALFEQELGQIGTVLTRR
jgi:hypothetical protein